jgi:hypothetical protein
MRWTHPPLADTGRVMIMRHRSGSRAARRLEAEDGQTTITGPVVDQGHLHGLLDRVRDLGLELVSVNATFTHPLPASDTANRT